VVGKSWILDDEQKSGSGSAPGPSGPTDCGPCRKPWEKGPVSIAFQAPTGAKDMLSLVNHFCRPCRGSVLALLLVPMAAAMGHILPPLRGLAMV
jgi:hypothetical protein